MILRKLIPVFVLCWCLSSSTTAEKNAPHSLPPAASPSAVMPPVDFGRTVVPITEFKLLGLGIEGDFGTGFCLDPDCRFVGTNYHVAMMARPRKINGQKVVHFYLATGPDDEDATVNDGPLARPMKYALSRDLAIFELRRSVPHLRGAHFSLDELQVGQQVDIFTYPMESVNPFRGLLQFHSTFKGQTTAGLLAFDYTLSADKAIRPGASGGIVVDAKTQRIVGVLNSIADDGNYGPVQSSILAHAQRSSCRQRLPCCAQSHCHLSRQVQSFPYRSRHRGRCPSGLQRPDQPYVGPRQSASCKRLGTFGRGTCWFPYLRRPRAQRSFLPPDIRECRGSGTTSGKHKAVCKRLVPQLVINSLGCFTFGTDSSLTTGPGWDNVTGLGTPNGEAFVEEVLEAVPH